MKCSYLQKAGKIKRRKNCNEEIHVDRLKEIFSFIVLRASGLKATRTEA